jgi:hypothetical protein
MSSSQEEKNCFDPARIAGLDRVARTVVSTGSNDLLPLGLSSEGDFSPSDEQSDSEKQCYTVKYPDKKGKGNQDFSAQHNLVILTLTSPATASVKSASRLYCTKRNQSASAIMNESEDAGALDKEVCADRLASLAERLMKRRERSCSDGDTTTSTLYRYKQRIARGGKPSPLITFPTTTWSSNALEDYSKVSRTACPALMV